MTALSIRGLVKRHGDFAAVDHVDIEVTSGELVVLLGPSGCGKTTTLRCIAGLEEISEGEIAIGDKVVSSARFSLAPEERSIGMVFQSYALWPHMTVAENLAFGLKLRKLPQAQIDKRVRDVLELVGLTGLEARGAGELSGGQQQRVALARAIVLEPKILLFDEPLSNLDAKMRERMRVELRRLQKRLGITAIYVTHDQQEAMVIADRVILMNQGKIEQAGAPREIYAKPRTRFAAEFIGSTNILPGRVAAAGAVILDSGAELACDSSMFAVGARVQALIRPEFVRLSSDGLSGANVFAAEITEVSFLGNLGELEVQVGAMKLLAQMSPAGEWAVGDGISVQIDPAALVLLPLNDG